MATTREIRDRIQSIDSTLKITSAMYLISSTKLRKARAKLQETEPYFYALQMTMQRLLRHLPEEFTHPYLDDRAEMEALPPERRKAAIICVTADKGLAGSYNHNVLRKTEELLREFPHHKLFIVGETGRVYFHETHVPIEEQFHYTAQNPSLHRARVITGRMLDLFEAREIDEVYLVYTRMKNSLVMKTEVMQLLPLDKLDPQVFRQIPIVRNIEELKLSPDPETLIRAAVPNAVSGYIYSALVESFCSEQNSRMNAMDAANKSGSKLKKELQIQYNRVRQAAITQEITEVAAGANAQKRNKILKEQS